MNYYLIAPTSNKEGSYVHRDNFEISFIDKRPKKIIELLCLKNGTTLQGSYDASAYLLPKSYKRPIYIGGQCNQIYIPTKAYRNQDCLWINLSFCLNYPVEVYNNFGYEKLSNHRWEKHRKDGLKLRYAIFNTTKIKKSIVQLESKGICKIGV